MPMTNPNILKSNKSVNFSYAEFHEAIFRLPLTFIKKLKIKMLI